MKMPFMLFETPGEGSPGAGGQPGAAPVVPGTEPAPADSGIPKQGTTLINEGQPKEGEPPKEGEKKDDAPKPEAFDLTKLELPEGITIPDDKKEALTGIAQKHGISNDAMKDLMALQADTLKKSAAAPYELWQTTQKGWQDEVKADKEIGGDKLSATLQTVSKALDQYGTPGVRQALDFTGAGNNPDIVKTIHAMAKALGEAGHVGGAPPNQSNTPRDAASAIYPHLAEKG